MAQCEHDICTCEVPEGTAFCSDACSGQAMGGGTECHCHHDACAASHGAH
jgi:hypothetical protein